MPGDGAPGRAEAWVHRLLLKAYPRAFREEFGGELWDDFRRLRRGRSGIGLLALWMRAGVDMVRTGVQQRAAQGRGREGITKTGGGDMFGTLRQDVRYATRTLWRSPGYAAVVVATLALGIGANTAMFSLVDGVLLAPLPYAQGDRIVNLRQTRPGIDDPELPFSVLEIQDYRDGNHTLSDVVEYHNMTFTLLGLGDPELVQTGVVSAGFFDVLGMTPTLGRTFTEDDDRLGADPVMILSNEYWRGRFGADPDVIGRGYEMNGKIHTVVGVLPPIPQYPDRNDVYMPTSQCPTRSSERFIANRTARMMTVFGVLAPDVELEASRDDMHAVAARMAAADPAVYDPETRGYDVEVDPLKENLVAQARPTLLILMGTAGLILLIACANVASLALARAVRRGPELALRQALGAGRGRLARQLLTESTVLALLGGGLGVLLARGALGLLVRFASRFTPRAFEASVDGSVLVFALAVSLATGVFFGSVPALRRARAEGSSLGRSRAGDAGRGTNRVHAWLVAGQVALAFVLLTGAGLLGRTFLAVSSVDPGFRSAGVLTAGVTLPMAYYMGDDPRDDEFFDELVRRAEELPRVVRAARVQAVPMGGGSYRTGLQTEEASGSGVESYEPVMPVRSSSGYMDALGVPMLAGRALTEEDRALPETSAVLPRSLATRLWGEGQGVGRRFRVCSYQSEQCGDWLTVVGVSGDVRMEGPEADPTPAVYLADTSQGFGGQNVVVRTEGDPAALGRALATLVHELEPDAPVSRVSTLDAYVEEAVAPRKLTASLMAVFAGLALLVTLAGVAGVVAFATSRRTREIGVRLALGAEPLEVLAREVRVGIMPAVGGLVVGGVLAVVLAGALDRMVWGVPSTDPLTLVVAGVTLLAGAFLACWIPARAATRVDPVTALRSD